MTTCKQQVKSNPTVLCGKPAAFIMGTYKVPTCTEHAAKMKKAVRVPIFQAKK